MVCPTLRGSRQENVVYTLCTVPCYTPLLEVNYSMKNTTLLLFLLPKLKKNNLTLVWLREQQMSVRWEWRTAA
eukprot:6530442-Karenia_brevis.AAC.1